MTNFRKASVLGTLLLFGAAGCADLLVDNVNNPDRGRALRTPGDVEGLVSGAYRQWYTANHNVAGPSMLLSSQAFEHSATAANFGMYAYSQIPRIPIQNTVTHADYGIISFAWQQNYRVLAAVADGLKALRDDPSIGTGLGAGRSYRLRAYGKFMQGLAHGDLALLYDRAYVVDETKTVLDSAGQPLLLGEPVAYGQVIAASMAYFDEAIALAAAAPTGTPAIPAAWVGTPADITMAQLVQIANSFKVRYRANVARTPTERANVNWTQVLAETGAGLKTDYNQAASIVYTSWIGGNLNYIYAWASTWQQVTLFMYGMADQSGNYQRWLTTPLSERNAVHPGTTDPVLIVSPDLRFPQGTTLNEQVANWGRYVGVRRAGAGTAASPFTVSNAVQFSNAERGTWRWSQYHNTQFNANGGLQVGTWPEIDYDEMRLLAAEAHYHLGQLQSAADSINVTRVANGLNPATSTGVNTSCVPKLPSGACGDLWEQLKWESRMETWMRGPYAASWYFNGRGWGDLYRGTPLQFPIPYDQLQVLNLGASYTFGGAGGQFAAPRSTYAFPGE